MRDSRQMPLYALALAVAGSSTDRLPIKAAPMKGSVARAAAAYHSPKADTDIEEVYFTSNPGELLHGTQFLREVPADRFTRMGCEKPGCGFAGLVFQHVRSIVDFGETDFLPLLVLTRRGRSTGKKQYW